nr:EOG090X0DLG [Lepidurus arcticus]
MSLPSTSQDPAVPTDEAFQEFLFEVKEIEIKDSVMTPKHQIERLLRPGATYLNLNPFEVLQIDPELPLDDIKKKYRKLSFLVHPDKNLDDKDRAQIAFEIVNRAFKTLENEITRKKCLDIVEEAKGRTDQMVVEKKKKLKKEGRSTRVEEDNPEFYNRAVYVLTMKLFADMERKRRELENRDMEERKRKREDEQAVESKQKEDKEWQKNYEASREGRVQSWQHFQQKKSKKLKTTTFKPPKTKAETR